MFIPFDMIHEHDRQTDTQTDTAWRHRPHLCIASRAKNYDSMLSCFRESKMYEIDTLLLLPLQIYLIILKHIKSLILLQKLVL